MKEENKGIRKEKMKNYLYLSLVPEALIASQLSPSEFGSYYATGSLHHSFDQAIFFELDPNFDSSDFPISKIDELCKPHEDGSPHKSVYLSVYRVLERVPLSAFRNMYVVTADGKTLELSPAPFKPNPEKKLFLYQDLAPARPRVASILNPKEYTDRITAKDRLVHLEKLAFCDMKLGGLEADPVNGELGNLPYKNVDHLRDCLEQVRLKGGKNNKVVIRNAGGLQYRTIDNGFYVGGGGEMLFYPMPSLDKLENEYYSWWKSAQEGF